uniref:Dynein axonemal assembly factor 1 homolog n=1 Tax=Strigamia maritima TaxID=126957 RepID=T1J1S4_STRMM
MVSIYDCTEPTVISEELLSKAVEEQSPEGEAGRIVLQDGIKFAEAKTLVLSFRSILQIENLWSFSALQRLNLDNNLIEKIEGLDFLVNLKWLDLSFNNIEVIAGLNNLINLEDLSLFNNRIRKLENIENLQKLQVLCIGNNKLDELDNLIVVRRLKSVKTLNANGNPLATNPSYRSFVAALVPQIVYLDYRRIDQETKAIGAEKYSTPLETLNAKDKMKQARLAEKEIEDENDKLYQAACKTFRENLLGTCKEAFDVGLSEYYTRKEEVDAFSAAVTEATATNQKTAVDLVDRFVAAKTKIVNELNQAAEQDQVNTEWVATLTAEHQQQIQNLNNKLMENELYLSDQVEASASASASESLKEFERLLVEMTQNAMEAVRNVATQMRDQETRFHEQLADISLFYMDKVMKDEEVVPEHMKELFLDKDTVMSALGGSHDVRTNKIDRVEDKIVLGVKAWTDTRLETMRDSEIRRNRSRILEITHFVDCQRADIDEVERTILQKSQTHDAE